MATATNKDWLSVEFPDLKIGPEGIVGTIRMFAAYDKDSEQFTILKEGRQDAKGVILEESFEVEIKERPDALTSRLPMLLVRDIETVPDRHFNQSDKSACLCSPLEEDEFLVPELDIPAFMNELVLPFLYAQTYFTKYGDWPWLGYSHGAIGILESYFRINNPNKAQECVMSLSKDARLRPKIERMLKSRSKIIGHTPCICDKGDHSRRCHKSAMAGLAKLREDLHGVRAS